MLNVLLLMFTFFPYEISLNDVLSFHFVWKRYHFSNFLMIVNVDAEGTCCSSLQLSFTKMVAVYRRKKMSHYHIITCFFFWKSAILCVTCFNGSYSYFCLFFKLMQIFVYYFWEWFSLRAVHVSSTSV